VLKGARLLFGNPLIRFALAIEFVSAIAGAQILVNTVGHVKEGLGLNDTYYGWVMGAFGIGASIAAFGGGFDKTTSRRVSLIGGALLLGAAIIGANYVGYPVLLGLWVLAGLGQSLAEIPSETLIGEQIEGSQQGKVFGSHFAFSHLWWAIAYPIAGFTGSQFPGQNFLYGGALTLLLLGLALAFQGKRSR
jgi:NRE family putative nickel resistance protein-like MFS transporter